MDSRFRPCYNKLMSKNQKSGFTLIELLVVIAIIAIITAVIITSILSSRIKARDARRVSDVNQIQLALEQFFDKCHAYPVSLSLSANCTGGTTFSNFISVIPQDPSTHALYDYSTNSTHTDYVLHAALESNSDALLDSLSSDPPTPTTPSWLSAFTCSTPHFEYCVGPK